METRISPTCLFSDFSLFPAVCIQKMLCAKGHTAWSLVVRNELGASSCFARPSDVMSRYSDDARTGVVLLSGLGGGCWNS